jgi:hypothetical protein
MRADADGTTPCTGRAIATDVESADPARCAPARRVNAATAISASPRCGSASLNGSEARSGGCLAAGATQCDAPARRKRLVMGRSPSGRLPSVRRATDCQGRQRERAAPHEASGADVGGVAEASRRREGPARARAPTSRPDPRCGARVMAVPPHGHLDYNRAIPQAAPRH